MPSGICFINTEIAMYIVNCNITCADLQFDESSVSTAITKLRPDKAMGPDGLAPKLLLETKDQITYPLYLCMCNCRNDYRL